MPCWSRSSKEAERPASPALSASCRSGLDTGALGCSSKGKGVGGFLYRVPLCEVCACAQKQGFGGAAHTFIWENQSEAQFAISPELLGRVASFFEAPAYPS